MEIYESSVQLIPRGSTTKFRKILITGPGRSGTSAIASVFNHLGFFLGHDANPPIYEDVVLRSALKNEQVAQIRSTLENWTLQYKCVAWKDPKLFSVVGRTLVNELDESWLIILVYRDPAAIAMRKVFSDQVSFLDALISTIRLQEKLAQFAMNINKSVLVVSYEKLLQHPEQAIGEILNFVDIDSDAAIDSNQIWTKMLTDRDTYRFHAASKIS